MSSSPDMPFFLKNDNYQNLSQESKVEERPTDPSPPSAPHGTIAFLSGPSLLSTSPIVSSQLNFIQSTCRFWTRTAADRKFMASIRLEASLSSASISFCVRGYSAYKASVRVQETIEPGAGTYLSSRKGDLMKLLLQCIDLSTL